MLSPTHFNEVVVMKLFRIWITIFGPANLFISDNGGEFVNEDCESFGINVKTTAANSPWSNGICERHNGLIAEAFNKIIDDIKCSRKIAM